MSKTLVVILFTFCIALNVAAQGEKINWETDYKQALTLSRETGKPILVDFWAKWCKPCLVMDETFWTRSDVVEAVKSFVPLKLDYDIEKTLSRQFAVRGLPYIAFSDSFGSLIGYRRGFNSLTAGELTQISKDLPKDFSVLTKAFDRLEVKKDDSAALLEIADYYSRNKISEAAAKYYRLAYETSEIKQNAAKREAVAEKLAPLMYAAGNHDQVIGVLEDYLKSFPRAAKREPFYEMLIISSVNRGRLFAADIYLERLTKEFPASGKIKSAAQAIEQAKKSKDKS